MTRYSRSSAAFIFVIATTVILVAGFAQAQQTARGAGRGQQFPAAQRSAQLLNRMAGTLSEVAASDDQHKKIDPIIDDARKRFGDLVESLVPEPPIIRRQRLVDFLEDVEGKITANLSPEQAESFRQKVGDFRQELIGNFVARGDRGATSQPAMAPDSQPQRLGTVVERLLDYVNQIDLTDSQKNEVDALFSDTRKKLQDIQQGQGDANVQQRQQQVIVDLRQELAAILTPQQMERLRNVVGQNPNAGPRGGGIPGAPEMPPATNPAVADAAPAVAVLEPEIPMIEVGQPAPDFSLKRLDGAPAQLSQIKGRPVLIVFGSYSSPSFRQRAASLDKINRDYAGRLVTMVIYTRENHPVGDWNVDRNKDENVSVEQPTDMNGRIELARQAKSSLKVTLPFLMDTMDDATAKAYGGFTNAAYLIGRDGNVAAKQKWFEPYSMRADIEDLLK